MAARVFNRLAAFSRLMTFDRRGAGLLERIFGAPTHEEQMVDVVAVMDRADDPVIAVRHARYLAEHIPEARLLELPGRHTLPFGPSQDDLVDEIEEFLTGARHAPDPERILATVMFSDIVDSTSRAAEMGDRRWRTLLESMDGAIGSELNLPREPVAKKLG